MTQSDVYGGLEPVEVWRHFAALNRIPRPSGQEAAACAYVRDVAQAAGATTLSDARGNLVVRVPASDGNAPQAPIIAIQAHLDMVCEKRPDVQHDFARDPILPRRAGALIFAAGTTLGADNGIGAAAALALLTEPGLQHGPLELIFTVEEETGLHGAMNMDASLVQSRLLINLDSEDPDELTIGCAGGATTILRRPIESAAAPDGWVGCELGVSGLKGGHSGVQIHEPLANALKLLTQALLSIREAGIDFGLSDINGGTAHNAIPRDATALLSAPSSALPALQDAVRQARATIGEQWHADEPAFNLEMRQVPAPHALWTRPDRDTVLDLLDVLPHGILTMSETFPGKVETSSNLAQVKSEGDHLEIGTSSRSFVAAALQNLQNAIKSNGEKAGAEVEARDGYPGWQPNPNSRLLQVAEQVYAQVCGKAPHVEVVHAGLECGVIASKLPGLDAVSFGPLIKGAHTPEEYVDAPSVNSTWRLLIALLSKLAKEN